MEEKIIRGRRVIFEREPLLETKRIFLRDRARVIRRHDEPKG